MLRKFFLNKKVNYAILASILLLGLWQHTRSSWHGTFVFLSSFINYKVLHHGQISGHTITSRLDVAWHRQEHSLSCEIAALKMALSAYGLNIPESELIARLPFTAMGGDPNSAFVGDIDGRMGQTGYGVYWHPIAKVGNAYLRSEIFQASPATIVEHIDAGRPVVAWGFFGRGNKLSWTTPSGQLINGVNGEHARTIIGFSGARENPEGFVVLDPIYGEQYWSTSDLFENWAPFGHMGVVIYENSKWVKALDGPTIWEISSDAKIKYPLAMDWDRFLEYGGVPDGVKVVSQPDLDQMSRGSILY